MACPVINLRSDLLLNADAGGTWTYNGYSATFDGDDDNLAQFVGSPASPPEETASLIGDDPTLDPTGHTVGFYSFTYSLVSGGCSADNNIVLPIMATYTAGDDVSKTICQDDRSIFNLFDLIDDFGANGVDTGGSWEQLNGTPNPHPGFSNNVDPTLATFDVSEIDWPNDTFPIHFYYTTQEPGVAGFTRTRCPQCSSDHSSVYITMTGTSCCTASTYCYQGTVLDGTTIYKITYLDGSFIDNTSDAMNFPYTLPGDNATFEADLNSYLTNNGGGTCTIIASDPAPTYNTVYVDIPCKRLDALCTTSDCSLYTRFTGGICI